MTCPICGKRVKSEATNTYTDRVWQQGPPRGIERANHTHTVGPCDHEVSCEWVREQSIKRLRAQKVITRSQTVGFRPPCAAKRDVVRQATHQYGTEQGRHHQADAEVRAHCGGEAMTGPRIVCPVCNKTVKTMVHTQQTGNVPWQYTDIPNLESGAHTHSVEPCGHEVSCEWSREQSIRQARRSGVLKPGETLAFKQSCERKRALAAAVALQLTPK